MSDLFLILIVPTDSTESVKEMHTDAVGPIWVQTKQSISMFFDVQVALRRNPTKRGRRCKLCADTLLCSGVIKPGLARMVTLNFVVQAGHSQ